MKCKNCFDFSHNKCGENGKRINSLPQKNQKHRTSHMIIISAYFFLIARVTQAIQSIYFCLSRNRLVVDVTHSPGNARRRTARSSPTSGAASRQELDPARKRKQPVAGCIEPSPVRPIRTGAPACGNRTGEQAGATIPASVYMRRSAPKKTPAASSGRESQSRRCHTNYRPRLRNSPVMDNESISISI